MARRFASERERERIPLASMVRTRVRELIWKTLGCCYRVGKGLLLTASSARPENAAAGPGILRSLSRAVLTFSMAWRRAVSSSWMRKLLRSGKSWVAWLILLKGSVPATQARSSGSVSGWGGFGILIRLVERTSVFAGGYPGEEAGKCNLELVVPVDGWKGHVC